MNQGNVDLRKKVLRMCREYWEQKAEEEKTNPEKTLQKQRRRKRRQNPIKEHK